MGELFVQGRSVTAEQLSWIRELIRGQPEWGRWRLSLHIAEQWDWRNGAGQLKDMAARTLLLKLQRRGLITLPAHKRPRRRPVASSSPEPPLLVGSQRPAAPIELLLRELLPLKLVLVQSPLQRQLFARWLRGCHYLGYGRPVGENLQYLVYDCQQRLLACLLFGAAAWKCAPRDEFIGWSSEVRQRQLGLLANNMRFLILPWVRVKNLASSILSQVTARLSADWELKYGHRIYLLESFVEAGRFAGTSYRAANWQWVGQTQGRSRNDSRHQLEVPRKDIFLYPLEARFRPLLQR